MSHSKTRSAISERIVEGIPNTSLHKVTDLFIHFMSTLNNIDFSEKQDCIDMKHKFMEYLEKVKKEKK